jgi:hypothetical protein
LRTGTLPCCHARTGDTDSPAPRLRTRQCQDLRHAQRRAGTDTYGRITLAEITCRPTFAYQIHTGKSAWGLSSADSTSRKPSVSLSSQTGDRLEVAVAARSAGLGGAEL